MAALQVSCGMGAVTACFSSIESQLGPAPHLHPESAHTHTHLLDEHTALPKGLTGPPSTLAPPAPHPVLGPDAAHSFPAKRATSPFPIISTLSLPIPS